MNVGALFCGSVTPDVTHGLCVCVYNYIHFMCAYSCSSNNIQWCWKNKAELKPKQSVTFYIGPCKSVGLGKGLGMKTYVAGFESVPVYTLMHWRVCSGTVSSSL